MQDKVTQKNTSMKGLLFGFALLLISTGSFAQLLEDDFEKYNSTPRLNLSWKKSQEVSIDTNFYRSGKQSVRLTKEGFLIYKMPNERLGKLEFSMMTQGPGVWNVGIAISNSLNFSSEKSWETIETFTTGIGSGNFDTKMANINRLGQYFIRIQCEPVGAATPLYIDDIVLYEISRDAEAIIKEELREDRLKKERKQDFDLLMESASYSDARRLVKSYEKIYRSRVKTLAMLYDKSNMIKIVSGTASTLGDFNQLSNPVRYQKYQQLQSTLFPKLESIDTLFYSDQVKGRLEGFFKKIENPLNLAMGIGDMFTGGAVSKVVDSFKGLITKGFSSERLDMLGFNRKQIKLEKSKGIRLYLEAKTFFKDIEAQNERTLILNKKIFDVYRNSKSLNDDVMKLFIGYLGHAKVVADQNTIIQISKNQDYNSVDKGISDYFKEVLGDKNNFNKEGLTNRMKEIDAYMQRIDMEIAEYNKLSNQLSSFYSDFRKEVNRECPFKNVTSADKALWNNNVKRIKATIQEVEKSYNESYIEVNFKQ